MKKYITLCFLIFIFCGACSNAPKTKNTVKETSDKEIVKKLNGEWVVMYSWTDTVLIFKNKRDENYQQEIFPSYNTITFNAQTHTVDVKTYGEFGCGTAAVQNLMMNTTWTIVGELLQLQGEYSDYSGQHTLNNFYKIDKKEQTLILSKK